MVEQRSPAPLAPVRILKRPTVKWGNYAGLVISAMETGMIFLMTLYLQEALRFSPVVTGLIFGIPGLASVAAGPIAGRIIGRLGGRRVLTVALTVQGLMVLPLVFLGADRRALFVLVPALFIGFFAHVTSLVSYTVIGTSGLPDNEQGLATGLTSMTQQIALTIGAPVMVSVAASQADTLTGTHLALGVNVAVTLASVLFIWFGLRPRDAQQRLSADAVTATATAPAPATDALVAAAD
jgi:predicted MFS family arabinose efflux permease